MLKFSNLSKETSFVASGTSPPGHAKPEGTSNKLHVPNGSYKHTPEHRGGDKVTSVKG